MVSNIVGTVSLVVLNMIGRAGYFGVFFLMFLGAANVPVPSEIVMPFSGFAASRGELSLSLVIFFGIVGAYCGSLASYWAGRLLGEKALRFVSKISLHEKEDFMMAEKWFSRFGPWVVLIGQSLPIIRSFVALPAGMFKVPFKAFAPLSLISISIWTSVLGYIGFRMGENWQVVGAYLRKFDLLIAALFIILAVLWIIRHIKKRHGKK
ncbi:MAG: DedA family protein [Candidatus Colwellbacteria bacterium]|nr:DedA family protein [Candidatus Colwellbacteria bacterium]